MYINLNRPINGKSNFNQIINELAQDFISELKPTAIRPQTNIIESNEDYKIQLALPGITKKDLEIKIEKEGILIKAVKEKDESTKFVRREFDFSAFKRNFRIPKTVDAHSISAKMEKGILTLTLPKKEEAKEQPPRDIEIK